MEGLYYRASGREVSTSRANKVQNFRICFTILENRVVSHLALNAEERYNQLFAFNPSLFNEVPLNQIASMLGMTAETLSRIRKKQTRYTS